MFRDRDAGGRAPQYPLPVLEGSRDIRGNVRLRHEPASHVVDGGGQPGSQMRRIPQVLRCVKHVGRASDSLQYGIPLDIGEMHSQIGQGGPHSADRRVLVIEIPDSSEKRKQRDCVAIRGTLDGADPVVHVGLYAGAGPQQAGRIEHDPHCSS